MRDYSLRAPLLANAGFSLVTGLALLVFTVPLGGLLGVGNLAILRGFGGALLVHAAMLGWVGYAQPRRGWLSANLALLAPYPMILLALILNGVFPTSTSLWIVLADAVCVGALALWHIAALRNS